jgi:hypothetical protein
MRITFRSKTTNNKQTNKTNKHMKKLKTTTAGLIVGLISISATVAFACCDMSGSTICGAGSRQTPVVCSYCCPWPTVANCTGTSVGTPEKDSASGKPKGGSWDLLTPGACMVTITFNSGFFREV